MQKHIVQIYRFSTDDPWFQPTQEQFDKINEYIEKNIILSREIVVKTDHERMITTIFESEDARINIYNADPVIREFFKQSFNFYNNDSYMLSVWIEDVENTN